MLVLYGDQRLQAHLPFNPTHVGAVAPHLSFNTAVSFVTNTNWQSYGGENTMSHLTRSAVCWCSTSPRLPSAWPSWSR